MEEELPKMKKMDSKFREMEFPGYKKLPIASKEIIKKIMDDTCKCMICLKKIGETAEI
jgi:riboflavin synthase